MPDLPNTGVDRATAPRFWLLVPSFLLGPETWRGVGEVLTMLRQEVAIAAPGRTTPNDLDHLSPWLIDVLSVVPDDLDLEIVAVGHSASCPRMPMVVDALLELGHSVQSMILVNGRFPEDDVVPTDRNFPMLDMLDNLVRPDDYLPPWHRWWGPMVEDMLPDDAARSRVFREAKATPRAIFDQPIPAPKLPGEVGLAYLAMGDMYRPSHDQARAEGWAIARIEGEHLHMVVEPVLVASSLLSLAGRTGATDADGRE